MAVRSERKHRKATLWLLAVVLVGAGQPLPAQERDSVELYVQAAIERYYVGTISRAHELEGMRTGPPDYSRRFDPACTGLSLEECFGGDLSCAWYGAMCNPRRFVSERNQLVVELSELHRRFPHRGEVVGQLVDAALKNNDFERAWNAADTCEAARWWCQALRGYVLHRQSPGSGHQQLDSACTGAPEGTLAFLDPPDPLLPDRGLHCEWRDVGHLLPDGLQEHYEAHPCERHREFQNRFWWLADPLWSVSGNLRLSEHVVRNIRMRLYYELYRHVNGEIPRTFSHTPHALHPEWTRNGFYNSWRTVVRREDGEDVERIELYVNGGYSFAPSAELFLDPMSSAAEDWEVQWGQGPERMITREEWHNVRERQSAALLRDDGLLVLSAARLPVLASSFRNVDAALAMGRPDDLHVDVAPARVLPTGVVRGQTELPVGDWVTSLEILGQGWRARLREAAPAPSLQDDGFGLSDPVLVEPEFEENEIALEDALLPSTVIRSGEVGIYFELYGVEQGETLDLHGSLQRPNPSWIQRIAGALGFGSDQTFSEVGWEEPASTEAGRVSRYLLLDLSSVDEGEYELQITVSRGDGTSVTTERSIEIVDP